MDDKLFLDTKLLRQHVTQIERELRCAQTLYDHIETARNLTAEELRDSYSRLLEDTQCLVTYFRAMANVIDNVSTNAEQTVLRIGRLLQDMADSNPANAIFRGI